MPFFTDLTGLASVATATAASLLLLPKAKRIARQRQAMVAGAIFVIALIPFSGFPLAAYVRGATGDLSITTTVLLWCAMLRSWTGLGAAEPQRRLAFLLLVALAALALYPMALGVGAFDPYRLGYGNPWFVTALLLLALLAWNRRNYLPTLCIALATFAWSMGWYESDNLWDYLLDPFVSIYALAAVMMQSGKLLLKQQLEKTD